MVGYDDVILFKDELKSYRRLNIKKLRLRVELDKVQYDMTNVKAIQYDKEPGGSHDSTSIVIALLPKKEKIEEELSIIEARLNYVDKVLSLMTPQDKSVIIDIYLNGISYEDMAGKEHYSTRGLKKKVNKMIKSALGELENVI